ncbi:MAG: F0F1 ATP synthase subunit B [Proteobacteria bacterium]|nr:F0F1 ATP synthase subunit B [Pseudomonadota bacterium]
MNINFTLVMQAIAFFVFIVLTAKYVWPIMAAKIDARQKMIADGLAAAERGRSELANAEKQTAAVIAEAKAKAQEIVAQGEKFRADTVEAAKREAKVEADRIVAAAKAEIEQEVARAKESLRTQVSTLAVAGAGKILQREVDPQAHAALLREIQGQL